MLCMYSTFSTFRVFSSPHFPKKNGFWFTILQNRTKYYAKFLAKSFVKKINKKMVILHFEF